MPHIVELRQKRKPGRNKPQRLLYRAGITNDELARLVLEVGREHVEGVLKALDLPVVFTPAE
jgi:hypothetical protein